MINVNDPSLGDQLGSGPVHDPELLLPHGVIVVILFGRYFPYGAAGVKQGSFQGIYLFLLFSFPTFLLGFLRMRIIFDKGDLFDYLLGGLSSGDILVIAIF